MYEERPMFRGKALEELARPDLMVLKALELSDRPGYERPVALMTSRQAVRELGSVDPSGNMRLVIVSARSESNCERRRVAKILK
jgi:hypothetical protein